MTKHEKVKAILEQIKELFPDLPERSSVHFAVYTYCGPDVRMHGFDTYKAGTDMLRSLDCGDRQKDVWPEGKTVLRSSKDGVAYTVFCESLPPTCHKQTYMEKIPKQKTVDTGDFVEVERTRVVCSEKAEVAAGGGE